MVTLFETTESGVTMNIEECGKGKVRIILDATPCPPIQSISYDVSIDELKLALRKISCK